MVESSEVQPKLPAAAQRWLDSVVAPDAPSPERIWVGERGEMEAQGRWLSFKSTGTYETRPFSYDWRGRLRLKTALWILVKDGHAADKGWGGAWLYGIKSLGQREGPDVLVMQMIRSLAELAWVPDLARAEPSLKWTDAGKDAFEISHVAGSRTVSVRFDIDERGDVVRASSKARPYDVPDGFAEAPWRCDFGQPREFDGVRIPSTVVATFERKDGPWEYFRGEVTSVDRQDIRE